jgi:succinate dehydrogenase/fumarate reductase cytochrome b subunit
MTQKLHSITGLLLALFIISHLAVHLFALAGPDAHNAALKAMQGAYRNPVIEPLLVIVLLVQVALGLRLALRRWREPTKPLWGKLQIASGLYLAYFIINHTGAALYTRYGAGLDTNFWWVSGPLHHPLMKGFFYPYYALAALSVAIHAGAVLHFRGRERSARLTAAGGVLIVLCYWASFGGWLYPVAIRADYRAYYDGLLAALGVS